MIIQGFDPGREIGEMIALDILRAVAYPPYESAASRPAQLIIFALYALITEMRNRNWESDLFLGTRKKLDNEGDLERIRRWLGWQWQRLYDDDDFGGMAWDVGRDKCPEEYEEVFDFVDYDVSTLLGPGNEMAKFECA